MKRRVKTERIIILLLSLIVIVLSIFLLILLHGTKKNTCSVEEKNNINNKTEIVCGDDSDVARFMCNRFHENGYIITFKEGVAEDRGYESLNELLAKVGPASAMYVNKVEINSFLKNIYGLMDEKDFEIDSFIFVANHGDLSLDTLKSAVKSISSLDSVVTYKVHADEKEK